MKHLDRAERGNGVLGRERGSGSERRKEMERDNVLNRRAFTLNGHRRYIRLLCLVIILIIITTIYITYMAQ